MNAPTLPYQAMCCNVNIVSGTRSLQIVSERSERGMAARGADDKAEGPPPETTQR